MSLELVEPLWGNGIHSLCVRPPGGQFRTYGRYATPDQFCLALDELGDAALDVWWGVNPLDPQMTNARGDANDVVEVVALYADLDWADDAHSATSLPLAVEVRSGLAAFPASPSFVIDSGHGLHAYWRLAYPVQPAAGRALQEHLHAALRVFHPKPERRDLASVLRVPGTFNHKNGHVVPVVIEWGDPDVIHDPAEIGALPVPPEPSPPIPLAPQHPPPVSRANDPTPAEWFNEHTSISTLFARYGWSFHSNQTWDGQATEMWTRPGKATRDGESARYIVGSEVVIVFTTYDPALCRRDNEVAGGGAWRLDAFEFYAAMEHGGTKELAASHVRQHLMPKNSSQRPLSGPVSNATGSGSTTTPPESAEGDAGRLPGERSIMGESVDGIEREEITWLWEGRLPRGKVVILDGDPALGKSLLTLDWAARLSQGRGFPDEEFVMRQPMNSLIVTAEDGIGDTVRPRLEAADADLKRIHTIEVSTGMFDSTGAPINDLLRLPTDVGGLARYIVEHEIKYVVLDVLVAFMEIEYSANNDQHVRLVLGPLARMADETGACVVALRHLNKNVGLSAQNRGGGSVGIGGAARVALMAGTNPEDSEIDDVNERRKVLAVSKVNVAQYAPSLGYRLVSHEGTVRVEWLGAVHHTADDLVAPARRGESEDDRTETQEFLLEMLQEGPVMSTDIYKAAKQAGYSEGQMKRAKKALKAKAHKSGMNDAWYWILPDSAVATPSPEGNA